MGTGAAVMQILGGAAGATTELVEGSAAVREAKRQQKINEMAAQQTEKETEERIAESERQTKRLTATQLTNFLKSGVALQGTPTDIFAQTQRLGVQDVAALRRSGEAQSRTLRAEGRRLRRQGQLTKRLSFLRAFGTAISSVSQASGSGGG